MIVFENQFDQHFIQPSWKVKVHVYESESDAESENQGL